MSPAYCCAERMSVTCDEMTLERHLALSDDIQIAETIQKSYLAATRRTHDRDHLAAADFNRDSLESGDLGVPCSVNSPDIRSDDDGVWHRVMSGQESGSIRLP